ncbi:MAG: hypothetical protein ACHP85_17580 [Burkholderiales bacterium]|jgi:hypothetical protein
MSKQHRRIIPKAAQISQRPPPFRHRISKLTDGLRRWKGLSHVVTNLGRATDSLVYYIHRTWDNRQAVTRVRDPWLCACRGPNGHE